MNAPRILPMFWDNLSVPSSGFKNPKNSLLSQYGVYIVKSVAPENRTDICPETSVRNYHYTLRNDPEERGSHRPRGGSLQSRADASTVLRQGYTVVHPSGSFICFLHAASRPSHQTKLAVQHAVSCVCTIYLLVFSNAKMSGHCSPAS